MQNPLVIANSSWLKKGKKQLFIEASSWSAPVAITVIGRKKMSLAKKMKINDFLLKIPLNQATYLPTVSPMLQERRMRMTDQLIGKSSKVLLKLGPGKSIKVITKVNMMIQGQGQICLLVSSKVIKQFCPSILFSSLASASSTAVITDPVSSLSLFVRGSSTPLFSSLSSCSSGWTKNFSILCLQTADLQKAIFMKRSKVLKARAMMKQMMMGVISVLSEPKIAKIIMRITVMKSPETAVPTVNLETTS